jgi:hypothetical protein
MSKPVIDRARCIKKRAKQIIEWLSVVTDGALLLLHEQLEEIVCLRQFFVYPREIQICLLGEIRAKMVRLPGGY